MVVAYVHYFGRNVVWRSGLSEIETEMKDFKKEFIDFKTEFRESKRGLKADLEKDMN